MGNSCSSFKLYLEKKVAGSITKRTLAKDAKPITKDGQPEPPELAAIHDSWDALLANHLRPSGAPVDGVKYAAVSYLELAAEDGFAALVESIAKVSPNAVKSWPPNAQCAFYINAYNILCAEHVCRTIRNGGGLPASVKDCVPEGSKKKEIWDVPAGAVAGQTLSLNEIEHGVIRTRWDEPRVHACVNCASRSCPDLLGQAYRGDDRLDYQLTAQFRLWLRDETKGLTFDEKKPMLSRIFLWYAGDFETRGGSPAYAAQYAPAGAARDALATTAPDYFAYDWNLNTQ